MFDIRTEARWPEHAQAIVADVAALVNEGVFRQVNKSAIDALDRACRSNRVRAAIASRIGYVHHDLCAENIWLRLMGAESWTGSDRFGVRLTSIARRC